MTDENYGAEKVRDGPSSYGEVKKTHTFNFSSVAPPPSYPFEHWQILCQFPEISHNITLRSNFERRLEVRLGHLAL